MDTPHRKRMSLPLAAALTLVAPLPTAAQIADTTALNDAAIAWMRLLEAEQFDSAGARLDPAAVAAGLTTDQLRTVWGQIGTQLGEMESLEPGEVSESQGMAIADLVGTFTNGVMTVRVVFNAEMHVTGFFIRPPATVRAYPELNHLFAAGEGTATPAEYGQPMHLASAVVDDLAGWVAAR